MPENINDLGVFSFLLGPEQQRQARELRGDVIDFIARVSAFVRAQVKSEHGHDGRDCSTYLALTHHTTYVSTKRQPSFL